MVQFHFRWRSVRIGGILHVQCVGFSVVCLEDVDVLGFPFTFVVIVIKKDFTSSAIVLSQLNIVSYSFLHGSPSPSLLFFNTRFASLIPFEFFHALYELIFQYPTPVKICDLGWLVGHPWVQKGVPPPQEIFLLPIYISHPELQISEQSLSQRINQSR